MMKLTQFGLGLFFILLCGLSSCYNVKNPSLQDIQVIGSHNSYKIAIEKPLWDSLSQLDSAKAISLQYGHPSITEQLDLGLRNLELDIFYDPQGGHYTNPQGIQMVMAKGDIPLAYDIDKKLNEPGLKMFHIQDIDFRSHHLLFKDGLQELKQWSDAHPGHWPIIVLINAKDSQVSGTRSPLKYTKAALDSVDMEISQVFPLEQLLIPDTVRGDFENLEASVLQGGWPTLEACKGKFLFVLDEKEDKIRRYLDGHAALKNRIMFVNSKEGNPEAGFRIVNNPIKDFEYIQALVKKGYLVRTRADANTVEARKHDYTRFERAKQSGAQVISTDYYIPTTLFPSHFQVRFEGGTYKRIKE